MSTRKITVDMLRKHTACPRQVKIFRRKWPNGAVVTLKNCKRAMRLGLDIAWAAECLLNKQAHNAYESAIKTAFDAYIETYNSAADAYEAAIKPFRDAYYAADKSASDAHAAAKERAFCDAWKLQRAEKG